MNFFEIKNQDQLDSFVAGQEHSRFTQSWRWGEYQKEQGQKIIRWAAEKDGQIMAAATLIKKNLGIGMWYWYAPKGPVMNYELRIKNHEWKQEVFSVLWSKIKNISLEKNAVFLRFEPSFIIHHSLFSCQRTIDVQPSRTIILNLSKSEDELLAAMHQKTRYNIRLAEKKGVRIVEAGAERFDEFWALMEQTKDRDEFRLHSREHYRKMVFGNGKLEMGIGKLEMGIGKEELGNWKQKQTVEILSGPQNLQIKLFIAEYGGKAIAASIIAFFGDTVTYMHGASSNQNRNVMAPFLLQWSVIRMAKALGYKYYDFYGINEKKWPGVTRFKRGFSAEETEYPGTYDVIFSPLKYGLYKFFRKIRRMV